MKFLGAEQSCLGRKQSAEPHIVFRGDGIASTALAAGVIGTGGVRIGKYEVSLKSIQ